MKKIGFVLCLLGFACLIFVGVLGMVHIVGTDAEYYYELQTKAGILDRAGISEEDLVRLDEALADCLKGNADALHIEAEVFGSVQPAFNEKELIHMEDCRRLFELLRSVLRVITPLGCCITVLGCVMMRDRKKIRLSAWLSPLVIVVPLGLFALWGIADFNAAFTFFHEILFTNDLWLLNWNTDLLIRLCPSSMFMAMGVRIGLLGLCAALAVPALATLLTAVKKERV